MKKEVVENIEYIRGFLYKYKYEDNVNKIRPVTKAELNFLEFHKPPHERFMQEEIRKYVKGANDSPDRRSVNVYGYYHEFTETFQNKPLTLRIQGALTKYRASPLFGHANQSTRRPFFVLPRVSFRTPFPRHMNNSINTRMAVDLKIMGLIRILAETEMGYECLIQPTTDPNEQEMGDDPHPTHATTTTISKDEMKELCASHFYTVGTKFSVFEYFNDNLSLYRNLKYENKRPEGYFNHFMQSSIQGYFSSERCTLFSALLNMCL